MASIITPSTTYDSNYSKKVQTTELIVGSLTDGTATFSGGTITNLIPPTSNQDAVTKGFVDGLVTVAPPVNSVQFNNLTFGGSANLTFVPNTLTVNGIIEDGSGISISAGVISGLNNPTTGNAIATKNYVDSFSSTISNNYVQSDIGVTYTAAEMINAVILRNLATNNVFGVSLTDITATASQLIAFVPTAAVGYAAKFRIMNDNPDSNATTVEGRDRFTLTLNPGTGVTFNPSTPFNIPRGYMFDAYIVFTNILVPAVTIIINRCAPSYLLGYLAPLPSSNFTVLNNTVDYLNYNSAALKGNLLWNVNNTTISTTNYSYTTSDIKNQFIIRNPPGVASDTFGFNINPRYINQIMTIQNPSAFSVVLNGQTDIWNLIPNPISIPAGKQVVLSFTTVTPIISNAGSYYNTGLYNTNGGTGSGLTITVIGIITTQTLTNAGLNYVGGNVTTTNLTTMSATGLVLNITVDGSTGAINSIQNIVNFLYGGYQDGDIIQINGGDGTARIQLNLVNSISDFYVNTLGNGAYLSTDVLNVSGPGTGSGAQLTLGAFITVRTIGKFSL